MFVTPASMHMRADRGVIFFDSGFEERVEDQRAQPDALGVDPLLLLTAVDEDHALADTKVPCPHFPKALIHVREE